MKISNLKRILSALLLAAMVISLCACSSYESTGTGSGSDGAAASGNGGDDMRMVGTVRTTYDDYLKANPDSKMIYADPIEADLTAAVFSMDTEFVPVDDEPEQAETEAEAEAPAEAEAQPAETDADAAEFDYTPDELPPDDQPLSTELLGKQPPLTHAYITYSLSLLLALEFVTAIVLSYSDA